MKQKKVPLRMCLGCQTSKPKKELIRIVRDTEGSISLDFTGKKNGRGAYICLNNECFKMVWKAHKLEKVFEMKIDEEIYKSLDNQLNTNKPGGGAVGKN